MNSPQNQSDSNQKGEKIASPTNIIPVLNPNHPSEIVQNIDTVLFLSNLAVHNTIKHPLFANIRQIDLYSDNLSAKIYLNSTPYFLSTLLAKHRLNTSAINKICYRIVEGVIHGIRCYTIPTLLDYSSILLTEDFEPQLNIQKYIFYPLRHQIENVLSSMVHLVVEILVGTKIDEVESLDSILVDYKYPHADKFIKWLRCFQVNRTSYLDDIMDSSFITEVLFEPKMEAIPMPESVLNFDHLIYPESDKFKNNLNLVTNIMIKNFPETEMRTYFNIIHNIYCFPGQSEFDEHLDFAIMYLNFVIFGLIAENSSTSFLEKFPKYNYDRFCRRMVAFLIQSSGNIVQPSYLTCLQNKEQTITAISSQIRRPSIYKTLKAFPGKNIPDEIINLQLGSLSKQ